jgi:hypothetical protein
MVLLVSSLKMVKEVLVPMLEEVVLELVVVDLVAAAEVPDPEVEVMGTMEALERLAEDLDAPDQVEVATMMAATVTTEETSTTITTTKEASWIWN